MLNVWMSAAARDTAMIRRARGCATVTSGSMLFYAKKHLALELLVAFGLGGIGLFGARWFGIALRLGGPRALAFAALSAAALTAWTFAVQQGYALVRGRAFARDLTVSLARHYREASSLQALAAALAAAGEEIFFRGFIQGRWGIFAGALAFMAAHVGARDIRVIGYWSVFQGLLLGAAYALTGELLVPIVAHGLFDLGAMLYFRRLMAAEHAA